MNHASQPEQHDPTTHEGARPVHPDGEIDEPGSGAGDAAKLDAGGYAEQAAAARGERGSDSTGQYGSDSTADYGSRDTSQYGGTTGAERDGGREQMAAEMAEATDATVQGRSPHGAEAPVDGDVEPIYGAGSPTEGTGAGASYGGSRVQEAASPVDGLGRPTPGTGSPVQAGAGSVQDAASPVQGLGPSPTGEGAPVQDADSPARGTGPAVVDDDLELDETRRVDPLG